ncbi:MAG: Asp-tRNA(Asn)/Glu-tRNA(Gln) amidotransferase subunit GatB [Patescibacteria group bacterium]|jgi:aspartyl-tRNA(Asn)/glutamyl-tRNA(Gln) amidotransferase subunit B
MNKELKTTIGLEIHVQLKTKSKMFCRCDNNAEDKAPNTVVCPVCLALPGALPVANRQAIEWTIKTGLAINSTIPEIAKFDRKHYFYPDLPKGYQISQYDEPFCVGGEIELGGHKVRFNRIHLEEDAGKLIHFGSKSLVDLNRAGTPLMEMVTEPDITSPRIAADFLRRLQKLVRDEVQVSEADMEKGHMRCDANISVTDGEHMSEIVEIKNLNSFRFVEKALILEEERLIAEYPNWPEKRGKVTRGYDSKNNKTYVQRVKEEAADYRYFPEPDLPPFETSVFDLEELRRNVGRSYETIVAELTGEGVAEPEAKVLASDNKKFQSYSLVNRALDPSYNDALARAVVHNYFGFDLAGPDDEVMSSQYTRAVMDLKDGKVASKMQFAGIVDLIHSESCSYEEARKEVEGEAGAGGGDLSGVVQSVLSQNSAEVDRYKAGEKQLLGFFMGQAMKETGGKADPKQINELLRQELEK